MDDSQSGSRRRIKRAATCREPMFGKGGGLPETRGPHNSVPEERGIALFHLRQIKAIDKFDTKVQNKLPSQTSFLGLVSASETSQTW